MDAIESVSQTRQLAAILFADMTGYTAMMQDNEEKAKVLRDHQRQTLQTLIPHHNGKIIQYFGDGTLSLFDSAIDAVRCAIAIQNELQKAPKVQLRIGIHTGDIVYDQQGVYGDCVNLASRIEALSISGGVLISDKVYDEVKNQNDITTTLLGKFNLKNVKRQVELYAITNKGLIIPSSAQIGMKAGSEKVLPFYLLST